VLAALEEAGGELRNRDLWEKARLHQDRGYDTLDGLVSQGVIERDWVMAPNRAGQQQRQVVWRLLS